MNLIWYYLYKYINLDIYGHVFDTLHIFRLFYHPWLIAFNEMSTSRGSITRLYIGILQQSLFNQRRPTHLRGIWDRWNEYIIQSIFISSKPFRIYTVLKLAGLHSKTLFLNRLTTSHAVFLYGDSEKKNTKTK